MSHCVTGYVKVKLVYTHTHYTHNITHEGPSAAVVARSRLPSEPALGHLCASLMLGISAGESLMGQDW